MAQKSTRVEQNNAFGIAGLILSILSVIMPVMGLLLAFLGIGFSIAQRKRNPNAIATAGIVIGVIGLIVQALIIVGLIVAMLYVIPTEVAMSLPK